jgi:hypothetical protein
MKSGTKAKLAAVLTAGVMMLSVAAPAMAVGNPTQVNAGNLISVLNNVNVDLNDVQVINVEDSVNNNTVNVNALQNFLNRNDIDVNIEDVLNNNNVEILNNLVTIQGISVDGTTLVIFV